MTRTLLLLLTFQFLKPCIAANPSSPLKITAISSLSRVRGGGSESSQSWSTTVQNPFESSSSRKTTTTTTYPIVEDLSYDEESTKEQINAFLSRDDRNTFITRVYAILTAQLVVTAFSILGFGLNPQLCVWMATKGKAVPIISLLLSTISWFFVCFSAKARRQSPLKWQLLSLFTIGEAISVGFISSFYTFRSVVSAMLTTAAASGSITMYTMLQKNPKYDLSQWGAGLASCGIIFLIYGFLHLLTLFQILPPNIIPYTELLYSMAGACLFSFYLAHHTRLIVSGKHSKYQMNSQDYIFGAMSLYNDIINMFIYILRLLGDERDDHRSRRR